MTDRRVVVEDVSPGARDRGPTGVTGPEIPGVETMRGGAVGIDNNGGD